MGSAYSDLETVFVNFRRWHYSSFMFIPPLHKNTLTPLVHQQSRHRVFWVFDTCHWRAFKLSDVLIIEAACSLFKIQVRDSLSDSNHMQDPRRVSSVYIFRVLFLNIWTFLCSCFLMNLISFCVLFFLLHNTKFYSMEGIWGKINRGRRWTSIIWKGVFYSSWYDQCPAHCQTPIWCLISAFWIDEKMMFKNVRNSE